jgi:hypothetical protein
MTRVMLLAALLGMAVVGCTSSFNTTTSDGHTIAGSCACFSYGSLHSTDDGATVNLGGKTVQVAGNQITWAGGGSLQLPAQWNRLELAQSGDAITVLIDGVAFATIRPAA